MNKNKTGPVVTDVVEVPAPAGHTGRQLTNATKVQQTIPDWFRVGHPPGQHWAFLDQFMT